MQAGGGMQVKDDTPDTEHYGDLTVNKACMVPQNPCNATHQEMQGTTIQTVEYTGTTFFEKDESCCAKCNANDKCTFWVRAINSNKCWLKNGYNGHQESEIHRGAFKPKTSSGPNSHFVVWHLCELYMCQAPTTGSKFLGN